MKKLLALVALTILVPLTCSVRAQMVLHTDTFEWEAVGDDGMTGTASGYEIRWDKDSTVLIVGGGKVISGMPTPLPAGEIMSVVFSDSLMTGTTYYFAIWAWDEVPNRSGMSNIVQLTVKDDTPPGAVIFFRWSQ